jgi:hypothetical protein
MIPNCSPITGVALKDSVIRKIHNTYKFKNLRKKCINPIDQFSLAVEIVCRMYNFYEGHNRFYDILTGNSESTFKPKISERPIIKKKNGRKKKGKKAKKINTRWIEDKIGFWETEEFSLIISQFYYFFRDYYIWNSKGYNKKLNTHIPEKFFNGVKKTNIAKFIMCLLLLIFRMKEKYGGILYENDANLIKDYEDDDDEEELIYTGKGRGWLWKKIVSKIKDAYKGRVHEERSKRRQKHAKKQLETLINSVEQFAHSIEHSVGKIKPRHENFKMCIEFSKQFAYN